METDALKAPNYTETSGTPTLKLTNSGQTVIYKFKDVQGPQISVDSQTEKLERPLIQLLLQLTIVKTY